MSPALQPSDNRDRLRSVFQDVPESVHASRWDGLWKEGSFLPWNKGHANPALIDLLFSPHSPPTSPCPNPSVGAPDVSAQISASITLPHPLKQDGSRRRVLIPGCGKGYDVALFAAHGYDAYGLEVSPHAADAANEYVRDPGEGPLESEYLAAARRSETTHAGKMVCLLGDFFSDEWLNANGLGHGEDGFMGFDLIYDNTFLCALPLSLRSSWAARMAQLLSRSGALICLEFPTHKLASSGGPPWSLPSTVHLELLKWPGEEISYDASGLVVETDGARRSEKALVRAAHYVPKRTHGMGIVGGVVRDCVSIWRHGSNIIMSGNQI